MPGITFAQKLMMMKFEKKVRLPGAMTDRKSKLEKKSYSSTNKTWLLN